MVGGIKAVVTGDGGETRGTRLWLLDWTGLGRRGDNSLGVKARV